MLDKLVNTLINSQTLGKLFMLWVITTIIASAVSISFVTNTASIAATESTTQQITEEQVAQELISPLVEAVLPERIIIDSLNKDFPVMNPQTTDIKVLDGELMKGAVRYPTSGTLGEKGRNIVIFGHTSRVPTYRGMYRAFNDIEQLTEGEIIVLKSNDKEYVYRVSAVYKKNAKTDKIALGGNNSKLILVTCDGFGKKSDRWIVESDFIGAYDL